MELAYRAALSTERAEISVEEGMQGLGLELGDELAFLVGACHAHEHAGALSIVIDIWRDELDFHN
jgi:hypothetical protein